MYQSDSPEIFSTAPIDLEVEGLMLANTRSRGGFFGVLLNPAGAGWSNDWHNIDTERLLLYLFDQEVLIVR